MQTVLLHSAPEPGAVNPEPSASAVVALAARLECDLQQSDSDGGGGGSPPGRPHSRTVCLLTEIDLLTGDAPRHASPHRSTHTCARTHKGLGRSTAYGLDSLQCEVSAHTNR